MLPLGARLWSLGARAFSSFLPTVVKAGAGYAVTVAVVEVASNYSDWVKRNRDYILITAALAAPAGKMATSGAKKVIGMVSQRVPKAWLGSSYSRFAVSMANKIKPSFASSSYLLAGAKVRDIRVAWTLPSGKEFWVKAIYNEEAKTIAYHCSNPAVPALLAASGVGGLALLSSDDEEGDEARRDFGSSLAAAALSASVESELTLLRRDLASESAGSILTSQRSRWEHYCRQFPLLSEDDIAKEIMHSLDRSEVMVGANVFETGFDEEGREALLFNGISFAVNEDGDLLNVPGVDQITQGAATPLADEYAMLLGALLNFLSCAGDVEFFVDDEFEVTKPITGSNSFLYIGRKENNNEPGGYSYYFIGKDKNFGREVLDGISSLTNGVVDLAPDNDVTDVDNIVLASKDRGLFGSDQRNATTFNELGSRGSDLFSMKSFDALVATVDKTIKDELTEISDGEGFAAGLAQGIIGEMKVSQRQSYIEGPELVKLLGGYL